MPNLEPLKIKCTSTSCEDDLHCFQVATQKAGQPKHGPCRSCGLELEGWSRIHTRDAGDIEHTFECLQRELIRHHFWHVPLTQHAINYARKKGRVQLREAIRHQLERAVGPAQPFRDGRQTPRENSKNPVHFAQHATASCCRRCIQEWHGIPPGRELTDDELDYLTLLAARYLDERLPDLTDEGEKVPPIRSESP